jgi:hypothetical protein
MVRDQGASSGDTDTEQRLASRSRETRESPAEGITRDPPARLGKAKGQRLWSKKKDLEGAWCAFAADDRNPTQTSFVSRKRNSLAHITKMAVGL